MNNFNICFIYFSFCAFVGWIMESCYRSIIEKRFIDAGFLFGPMAPIYGIAALLIYFADMYTRNMHISLRLFILFVIPIFVEYAMSWFLEKAFHVKLWDYSNCKFNINGRVCLEYGFLWFALVLGAVYLLQPMFFEKVSDISSVRLKISALILMGLFTINIIYSVSSPRNYKRIKSTFITSAKSEREAQSIILDINNPNKKFTYKSDKEFYNIVQDIIENPEYLKLKNFHHHDDSIFVHSLSVAYASYKLGKFINKYVRLNLVDVTRGAMFHDFFLYDWRVEKPFPGKLHAFVHPREAYKNSVKNFSPVSKIQEDVILKHMWPLNLFPPRYIESFVVVVTDKYVSSIEMTHEVINVVKSKYNLIRERQNQGKNHAA